MTKDLRILIVDDARSVASEMIREMANIERRTFNLMTLPPEMFRALPEVRTVDRLIVEQAEALPKLFGMQVRVSQALEGMRMPVRRHKKRRNQSVAYHRRIQKKWTKRWGTAPVAVLMNDQFLRSYSPGDSREPQKGEVQK